MSEFRIATTVPDVAGFVAEMDPGPVIVVLLVVTFTLVLSTIVGLGRFPARPRQETDSDAHNSFTGGS